MPEESIGHLPLLRYIPGALDILHEEAAFGYRLEEAPETRVVPVSRAVGQQRNDLIARRRSRIGIPPLWIGMTNIDSRPHFEFADYFFAVPPFRNFKNGEVSAPLQEHPFSERVHALPVQRVSTIPVLLDNDRVRIDIHIYSIRQRSVKVSAVALFKTSQIEKLS